MKRLLNIKSIRKLEKENRKLKEELEKLKSDQDNRDRTKHPEKNKIYTEKVPELYLDAERLAKIGGWIWNIHTKNWKFTKNWSVLHGLKSEEISHKTMMEIIPPDKMKKYSEFTKKSLKTKKSFSFEHTITIHRTGEKKYIQIYGEPVTDKQGNITHLKGVVKDITELKQASYSLSNTEKKYKALFEAINDAIFIQHLEDNKLGNFQGANQASIERYGYSRKELTGMNSSDLIAKSLNAQEINNTSLAKILKNTWDVYETIHQSKKGKLIPVEVSAKKFRLNDKTIIMSLVRDISERKEAYSKLSESEQNLKNYIKNAPVGILLSDNNGRLLEVNKKVEQATGYTEKELINKRIFRIILKDDYVKAIDYFKKISSKSGNEEISIRYLTKTGNIKYCTINVIQLKEDRFLGFHQDITAIKLTENELLEKNKEYKILNEKLNSSLEKIKRINHQLEESKIKAEESDRLKSSFLATMNHELKTPLNHILGFSDIISDMTEDDNIRKYARIISKSGSGLLTILEDIFALAMLEQNEIIVRHSDINIDNLFNDLKNELEEVLKESQKNKEINLVYEIDEGLMNQVILSDRSKITQVMSNLIRNAVKYTPKGYIKLGIEKKDDDSLKIIISDSGIGIPHDKQEIIFDFFRQVDTSNARKYEGLGIGLAISQKIAVVMGGRINLFSSPDKGSEFTFTFPVEYRIGMVTTKENSGEHINTLRGKKILIAEDDPISRELMTEILRETQCEILTAENGKQAVEKSNQVHDISCILMDIKMPVMDGITATKQIRINYPDTPIIAVTAYARQNEQDNAMAAGCNEVLTKPVNKDILLNKIEEYFK